MERGWNPNEEISLNCPRCGSCNTKFCYYNNYSLTQPRYFCKGCRRYWTKGGSLRNVPIGGGCRRSRRSTKSIRLSSAPPVTPTRVFSHAHSNNSDNFIHSSSTVFSSGCLVFKNDHCALCVSKSAGTNIASGTIDIAQVYANFLNHQPEAVQMTGLPPSGSSGIHPSFHFSSMHVEFSTSDNIMNDGLPPLPGEEVVPSNMEWPGSEIMAAPNHIFNASQMSAGIEQGIPQNSDPFIGNNNNSFHTSGYGYETLSRPW